MHSPENLYAAQAHEQEVRRLAEQTRRRRTAEGRPSRGRRRRRWQW